MGLVEKWWRAEWRKKGKRQENNFPIFRLSNEKSGGIGVPLRIRGGGLSGEGWG